MSEPTMPPTAPGAPAAPATGMLASMSQAEMAIAGGGALVVLTDLVFAIVTSSYSFERVIWAAAALAVALVLLHRRLTGALAANYQTLLIVVAAVATLMAVREIVRDLVFLSGRLAGLNVEFLLGMVGLYVGVALMAYGAWRLWQGMKA